MRHPVIPSVTYLKAVSEASSGSVRSLQSWTCASRCVSFSAAQPSHEPSSAISTQTEELMQLDCSRASSGTTSNDITSICAARRQQCSHLRETANRHGSRFAVAEAMRPHWEARQWTGQSICQFPQQPQCPSHHLKGDLEPGDPRLHAHRIWGESLLTGHKLTWITKDWCKERENLNHGSLLITAIRWEKPPWAQREGPT